jgi:glutathione S-transferase
LPFWVGRDERRQGEESHIRPRGGRPILIHVPVSHYSEKVRWALDLKRVPHIRRWPPGGLHPLASLVATHGRHDTVPALVFDEEAIGDSTAIIGRLEERYPDPSLYPEAAADRRRALELEDFFDEELGPYIRRWAYHHLTRDAELIAELAAHQMQYLPDAALTVAKPGLRLFLNLRFSTASPDRARAAEEKVVAALDRLEAELDGGEYLVGGHFTVADLTAAALLYPLVMPAQVAWRPSRLPRAWSEFLETHEGRPSLEWVAEMYRRHRG